MDVYIDFSNFLSLIHSAKDGRYGDCMRMIRDNFDIKFTFSKESIYLAEKDDLEDIGQWFNTMASGKGEIKWDSTIPEDKDLRSYPYNSSVYLLDDNANDSRRLNIIKRDIVLIATIGKELEVLSSLFVYNNQYYKDIFDKINAWEDVMEYTSPTTDLIIYDRYLLSSPELYDSNLIRLLKCLTNKTKSERINILIVTLNKYKDFEPKWDKIYSTVRKAVNKKVHPNVSFITTSKLKHDRYILTNYKMFISGDTFNYFDSTGNKITSGSFFVVSSLADTDNMVKSKNLVKEVKTLIERMIIKNRDFIKYEPICNL